MYDAGNKRQDTINISGQISLRRFKINNDKNTHKHAELVAKFPGTVQNVNVWLRKPI